MGFCARIKGNRVLYDEGLFDFVIDDEVIDFSNVLGAAEIFPVEGFTAFADVEVRVIGCGFSTAGNIINIDNLRFGINKNISVTTDLGNVVQKTISLEKCVPTFPLAKTISDIFCPDVDINRLHCQIHDLSVTETITRESDTAVRNLLTGSFVLKLSMEDQFYVTLCPVAATAQFSTPA